MSAAADTTVILEQLGKLLRELTRMTAGADEGPAMTATQRIALIEIADAGPLRLNDLAARIGTSAPTASRTVDTLDDLGLVARETDPADRRAAADRADTGGPPAGRRAQGPRGGRLRAGRRGAHRPRTASSCSTCSRA